MILYTSVINYKKQCKNYFILSVICLIFGIIYELFSHGVYSIYMWGAFLIPLLLGCLASLIFFKKQNVIENNLYNAGIITLTIGSILKGVLDIYGTTNEKLILYLILGVLFIVLSIIIHGIFKLISK